MVWCGVSNRLTDERTHPFFVDIPVAAVGLDLSLNRQITSFHKSRHELSYGHIVSRGRQSYYRLRFADLMTALAFIEQFGGAFNQQQITGAP
jgi:hypothetical protein